MKEYLKCYHVFMVWPLLRVICYVLYPVCMIFMGSWLVRIRNWLEECALHPKGIYFMMGLTMIMAEMVHALLVWGGIAAAGTDKLGYLQTSVRGKAVLKKALCIDVLRRWLTITFLFAIIYIQAPEIIKLWKLPAMVFVTIMLAEVGQMAIRRIPSFNLQIMVFFAIYLPGMPLMLNLLSGSLNLFYLIVPGFVALWVMVQSIHMVLRNERKRYYDEGTENLSETA